MTHGSLFSGIGGFDLAAQWMGWENKFHCEWNEFGKKVLHYYWPNAISYGDITKTDFTGWRGLISVLSGGFPCQPYSVAGLRKGKEDDRHLWPEMLRAIREIQPRWVVGENVLGLVNWSAGLVFHEVQTDLEAAGYEVWPYTLPSCGTGGETKRERVWFVAHAREKRWILPIQSEVDGIATEWQQHKEIWSKDRFVTELAPGERSVLDRWANRSTVTELLDGFSTGLDAKAVLEESRAAYGNSVDPHVVHQIFKAIQQYEDL